MDIEQSKEIVEDLIDGNKERLSTTIHIYDKECIALHVILNELEKKECKYIRQNDDWIVYQCSNCKMDWVFEDDEPKDSEFNYCPKCGAKIVETIEAKEN